MSKYVAYVSSYTQSNQFGISIFDVDLKAGRLIEKDHVKVSNSSYLTKSHNRKYLYSITDFGVNSYAVGKDGSLTQINQASINGMRGCYLSTSYDDKFLFVAGYHDGKITVLRLEDNGAVGEITEEIYLQGMGTISERNYRPHVTCVKMTRDDVYLLAADQGMDHVNVYTLNHETGKLKLADIIRSDQESAPRHIKMSKDGKRIYIVQEMECEVDVYSYENLGIGNPSFEKLQAISTKNNYHTSSTAACNLNVSEDFKYLVSSNAGDNSAVIFKVVEDGKLEKVLCLPISGEYPKDVALFPDNKHLVSCNHESNTLTFFNVNFDEHTIIMNGPEIKVTKPNCIIFHKLEK